MPVVSEQTEVNCNAGFCTFFRRYSKKARTEQELIQTSVAERVAIDSRTIINIENYNGNPKMEALFPLVGALHIDPWEIFYPELNNQCSVFRKLQILLKDCNDDEIEALLPVCEAVLLPLRSKKSIPIE